MPAIGYVTKSDDGSLGPPLTNCPVSSAEEYAGRRANPKSWRRPACSSHRAAVPCRGIVAFQRNELEVAQTSFSPVRLRYALG